MIPQRDVLASNIWLPNENTDVYGQCIDISETVKIHNIQRRHKSFKITYNVVENYKK